MELKPTLAMSKTGHVTWYEPDSLGGFDVCQIAAPSNPNEWAFQDNISRETFGARIASAYRVFEEVRR